MVDNPGYNVADELLVDSRFYFEAGNRVSARPILEITGLTIECPPANQNAVLGSTVGGQSMRQATPTRQKFTVLSLKLVAQQNDTQLFDWYTACNNENRSTWQQAREEASITAFTQDGSDAAEWTIVQCYPVKYSGPEFKAGDETMANETIDIVYENFQKTV